MYGRMKCSFMGVAMIGLAALTISRAVDAQHTQPVRRTTPAARETHAAPDDRNKGLQLGLYALAAPGITISGEDIDGEFTTAFGPGLGLMVGYGFNSTFTAFASLDLARQAATSPDLKGTFGLSHFEVGARANLSFGTPTTVPYVVASVGRRALGARVEDVEFDDPYDMSLSGMMFGLGGGFQHAISPNVALDAGLELGFGRLAHYVDDGDASTIVVNGSMSTRLRVGLTWHP